LPAPFKFITVAEFESLAHSDRITYLLDATREVTSTRAIRRLFAPVAAARDKLGFRLMIPKKRKR
jgi:hypothetical protein